MFGPERKESQSSFAIEIGNEANNVGYLGDGALLCSNCPHFLRYDSRNTVSGEVVGAYVVEVDEFSSHPRKIVQPWLQAGLDEGAGLPWA